MKQIENDCVSCGMPCLYEGCPYYRVEHYYCDVCGAEETLYNTDDGELCADCVLDNIDKVEGSY